MLVHTVSLLAAGEAAGSGDAPCSRHFRRAQAGSADLRAPARARTARLAPHLAQPVHQAALVSTIRANRASAHIVNANSSGKRERAPHGASEGWKRDQARRDRLWQDRPARCRPAAHVWHSDMQPSRCGCARVRACTTTMLPTAAAACAARGEGASPSGASLVHAPERTSKQCTSEVAPASRIPVAAPAPAEEFSSAVAPPNRISFREFSPRQAVSECPQRASGADALSSAGTRPTREYTRSAMVYAQRSNQSDAPHRFSAREQGPKRLWCS